jgi:protein-export membrane protein SecD
MKASWWYRFGLLAIIGIISLMAIVPTALDLPEESNFPMKTKINLGLDLQGGLYMILGIDFKKVYRDEIKGYGVKIENVLQEQLQYSASSGDLDVSDELDPKQKIILGAGADKEKAKAKIKEWFGSLLRLTGEQGQELQYALNGPLKTEIETNSVTKSIEVIRNRIDEFGVTEPEILSQGVDRIIVQLPGVKDIDRAKSLIGKTAKLEFKIVNDKVAGASLNQWVEKAKVEGITFKTGERFSDYLTKLNTFLKADLPDGFELAFQKEVSKVTNEVTNLIPYLVESTSKLTGDDLQDASVQIDQQKNQPYVALNFKARGATKFENITAENTGKRMAVILDGNVYTAPNIEGRIAGGRASITLGFGDFNQLLRSAKDIALVLRAGALPVQLDFLEQRIVGPSLGHDSIEKARKASFIGAALVFLFILIYYKFSGAIALVTLGLNILFVLACLVGLEATLTLPGIAGIALTIGMAVDANIIIYERIREEIRAGANGIRAVESGFDSAFWTIIDANITTALAGICLLNFGTGPIKGFAVTLLIGIFATVYTSYFVGKLFFEFYLGKVNAEKLSI